MQLRSKRNYCISQRLRLDYPTYIRLQARALFKQASLLSVNRIIYYFIISWELLLTSKLLLAVRLKVAQCERVDSWFRFANNIHKIWAIVRDSDRVLCKFRLFVLQREIKTINNEGGGFVRDRK